MIYDRGPATVYQQSGDPVDDQIAEYGSCYYAELQVYHSRFWESVQAGDRIDRMIQIPFGDDITADMFVKPEDGHIYRINQAQPGDDDNGLPSCILSLHREEANYDIIQPAADPEPGSNAGQPAADPEPGSNAGQSAADPEPGDG